ncbi:MAG: SGNH/GDSL hydrolase family protein [Clostridia bacterium]|nr:SGNH/GDSL hydrolase family protein [Clostridia bacterium]
MKKIALLGDSIRMNYAPEVIRLLGDEYEVISPEDNCRFCTYLQRMVFDMSNELDGCDVIHFNSGEWDVSDVVGDGLFTPEDVYVRTVIRIAEFLKTKAKTVIFATSTPVTTHPQNNNADIQRYNAAVVPQLRERGIVINDLWTLVDEKREENIRSDDGIHLTDRGIGLCSRAVAQLIKSFE